MRTVEAILDAARWAPSVDNTQPWRFELGARRAFVVHGFDARDSCVYDLDGRVSQLSLGALLETIRIAATVYGFETVVIRRSASSDIRPIFDVRLVASRLQKDILANWITLRSVQRRPFRTRPLSEEQRGLLERSVASSHRVLWLTTLRERAAVARMLFGNGQLRLRLPEAFEVHRRIIEWGARESTDKLPDQAIGLDAFSLKVTRWAFERWARVAFMNKYLAGSLLAGIELDLLPGIACGGHFVLVATTPPTQMADYLDAGAALQRFWLTATSLGLVLQPEVSPLVFARYVRDGRRYTASKSCQARGEWVSEHLKELIGLEHLERAVFMGRIGYGRQASARSTRLPLQALMVREPVDASSAVH
jgi:nitroreductase